MDASYRAVAIVKAKAGDGPALIDFTRRVIPDIRKVPGLRKVEVNRDLADPDRLLLYYWWASPEDSERYVAGPLYASFIDELLALTSEHQVYVLENLRI